MSTGATFVDFTEKRLLGNDDFDSRFMSYLQTLIQEGFKQSFRTGVVYDTALSLSASGADAFSVGGTSLSTDGLGHFLDIATTGFASGITFENTAAIVYDVALHFATVPDGVQINPVKGVPEYVSEKEFVGESADPSTVVDNGTTITFGVDSVAESGVSHAGRTARVFKKAPIGPNATTPGVAIEDATVVFTGGINQITTSGVLGQTTVSTTLADYTVVMLGPTVRRNTSLLGVDGLVFLGTVTGTGAGNPPTTFDTTQQDVVVASLSDLSDITSRKSSNRLRIDVKSFASDVGEDQILVRNPSGTPVFQVDGNGNVTIAGTTTQEDVVQVNSSETITDNLTAGDDDASDSHLIKGQWKHTNNAGSANHFFVDGPTGRIGIGQVAEASATDGLLATLAITGNIRLLGIPRVQSAIPSYQYKDTDDSVTTGGLWRTSIDVGSWSVQENSAAAGDFSTKRDWLTFNRAVDRANFDTNLVPLTDNARDLGISGTEWRDLWIDGQANIDELILGTANGQGLGSDMVPDLDAVRRLGSLTHRYDQIHTRNLFLDGTAGFGVGSDVSPTTDNTFSLGSSTRAWSDIFVTNINISGDFLPNVDATQDIGSPAFRWAEGHFAGVVAVDDSILTNSATATIDPGGIAINTLSADGRVFSLENDDVAHGVTDFLPTNAYFQIEKAVAASGGVGFQCASEDTIAWTAQAVANVGDTTTSASSTGCVEFTPAKKAGTGIQLWGTTENIFVIRNSTVAELILKGSGALHINAINGGADPNQAEIGIFDDEQDAVACQDIAYVMGRRFDKVIHYAEPRLEELGIMENGFMCIQRLWAMQLGAIGELYGVLSHLLSKQGLSYEAIRQEVRAQA